MPSPLPARISSTRAAQSVRDRIGWDSLLGQGNGHVIFLGSSRRAPALLHVFFQKSKELFDHLGMLFLKVPGFSRVIRHVVELDGRATEFLRFVFAEVLRDAFFGADLATGSIAGTEIELPGPAPDDQEIGDDSLVDQGLADRTVFAPEQRQKADAILGGVFRKGRPEHFGAGGH